MTLTATLCAAVLLCLIGSAAALPNLSFVREVGGLSAPVHITHAGDDSRRLFVVEQPGRIRIVRAGVLAATPFLDITGRVLFGGERGLLSVAFSPDFANSGRLYVDYTRQPDGATVISRFRVSADPDRADPAGEEVILVIAQPFANHNGGQLAFGPDGYLYIGMGDGGSGGDPQNNGQDRTTLLGKMLRIDVESGTATYSVPPTNPLLQTFLARPEIWALGLRNPWRFSFDRLTGDLYIADVGQNLYEEVNFQTASSTGGENYGWRIMEASHCFDSAFCNTAGLVLPVAEYPHASGDCSVTGGMVYRGSKYPGMQGVYLYGDYCTGRIRGLTRTNGGFSNVPLVDAPFLITTFGEDEAGNLYLADSSVGDIHRIIDRAAPAPLPEGRTVRLVPAIDTPVVSTDAPLLNPFGFGPAASGGAVLDLQIASGPFAGLVDMYLAMTVPTDSQSVYFLGQDGAVSAASIPDVQLFLSGTAVAGIAPWRALSTAPVDTTLATAETASLPSGSYAVYLLVTPAGRLDSYLLFAAPIVIP